MIDSNIHKKNKTESGHMDSNQINNRITNLKTTEQKKKKNCSLAFILSKFYLFSQYNLFICNVRISLS
jgi:hypothetical protein